MADEPRKQKVHKFTFPSVKSYPDGDKKGKPMPNFIKCIAAPNVGEGIFTVSGTDSNDIENGFFKWEEIMLNVREYCQKKKCKATMQNYWEEPFIVTGEMRDQTMGAAE